MKLLWSKRQLEAVEYGFVIVAGAIAFGLVLLARARRRDRHARDELRTHVPPPQRPIRPRHVILAAVSKCGPNREPLAAPDERRQG